jgi:hypothetical protein
MWKQTWSLAAIAFCVHCGGATQSATPAESAGDESIEQEPTSEAATSDEPESTGGDTGDEGSSATGGDTPEPVAKKKCAELDKSTCKVTLGCAWNEVQKCIEHGGGE